MTTAAACPLIECERETCDELTCSCLPCECEDCKQRDKEIRDAGLYAIQAIDLCEVCNQMIIPGDRYIEGPPLRHWRCDGPDS